MSWVFVIKYRGKTLFKVSKAPARKNQPPRIAISVSSIFHSLHLSIRLSDGTAIEDIIELVRPSNYWPVIAALTLIGNTISGLMFNSAELTAWLFNLEILQQLIFCLHSANIFSKLGHKRRISSLSRATVFTLLMSVTSIATAYELSIPDDPINDSVIVRLETTSNPPQYPIYPSDTEITHWWVQAGSTGYGSGQSDYFSSGELEAPVMTNLMGPADLPTEGVQAGTGNALVTNLPMNGNPVFLSVWLKRQDQPWEHELVSVITSSSTTTPTTIVERNRYSHFRYYFGNVVWGSTDMASWYQIWINDDTGTNVHTQWYRHKDVCMNTRRQITADCAANVPSPYFGEFWVRAWSVHGGYGPWSKPAVIDAEPY